ncbi:hypothetical protein HJC23_008850 [Cyclotella cryptica]|uniref:Potassium channel domain-containing protein n=1 Tax=Cyclotella cryptica TaxID=29204 RepID=A0ABD3QA23_9STRA|eukprot:CCRYP_007509-RC/>CCRYP_007509-RC protein AED:0.04 eAED:0.04 QI:0/1/0.83/1/0.6/0.5/6/2058/1387
MKRSSSLDDSSQPSADRHDHEQRHESSPHDSATTSPSSGWWPSNKLSHWNFLADRSTASRSLSPRLSWSDHSSSQRRRRAADGLPTTASTSMSMPAQGKKRAESESLPSANRSNQAEPSFDYFLSDPSMSEDEEEEALSNSHKDLQRKLLYRQRRMLASNHHATHQHSHSYANSLKTPSGDWDASSFGNTSLSSSNISPMPRFRIQFDASSNMARGGDASRGVNHNSQAESQPPTKINNHTNDINNSNDNNNNDSQHKIQLLGDMKKKFKAASAKIALPFGRMHSETSESMSSIDNEYTTKTTTLIGNQNDIMEAALMPPSTSTEATFVPHTAHDMEQPQANNHVADVTHSLETDLSLSSTANYSGSLRGTDILTEQPGGESSSSGAVSSVESPFSSPKQDEGRRLEAHVKNAGQVEQKDKEPTGVNHTNYNSKNTQQPKSKRKRLRFSKTHQPPVHRRTRSGDHVAAGIVLKNTQQEVDWIGMRMNGFLAPNRNGGNGSHNDATKYGSIDNNPFSSHTFTMGSPEESISSSPSQINQGMWPVETRESSHLSFSDSSTPNSPPRIQHPQFHHHHHHHLPHLQQQQQQQQQQSQIHSTSLSSFERIWDGENCLRFAPNRMDNYNYGINQHISRDSSFPYGSWSGGSNLTSSRSIMAKSNLTSSMGSFGHSSSNLRTRNSFSGSIGSSSDIMHNTCIPERQRCVDEHKESDSSGSSASTSSSSYDDDDDNDNSSLSRARTSEFQRLKTNHRAARHRDAQAKDLAKFDKVMKRVTSVLESPLFREPKHNKKASDDVKPPPTFFCPNCKTRQRAFFDVTTAAGQFESPLGYLALYFALYVTSVLFVFGLEEGWTPLDCVYFAVVTLTTAGLGDFVPSSDGAKLICACFIYFGVATIGLLLGSLLAGSLDDASKKDHHASLVRDCPNCLRLEKQKRRSENLNLRMNNGLHTIPVRYEGNHAFNGPDNTNFNDDEEGHNIGMDINHATYGTSMANTSMAPPCASPPPLQSHTKHMSLSLDATKAKEFFKSIQPVRRMSADFKTIDENSPFLERSSSSRVEPTQHSLESKPTPEETSTSTTSSESSSNLTKPMSRLKAVKYIVLTLNRALLNSLLIIVVGSVGFYFIEGMTLVDSFYFTTVLLTTVGYGDIVPVSDAGKVFTTVYVIVAGTILLHNMSMISMIPLELRKRRIEQTVLGQFGSQLTDDELQELSTGRLIQRLKLATNRPDGLDECTREMFSLAMLVRLGRITEDDVKATFAAFRRLDIGNYGTLNSRTIIEGEIWRIRSSKNLAAMVESRPMSSLGRHERSYSADDSLDFSQASIHYNPYAYVMQSPNPFMNPINNNLSHGSLRRLHSADDSNMSAHYTHSISSSFDFDAYERWNQGWRQYESNQ